MPKNKNRSCAGGRVQSGSQRKHGVHLLGTAVPSSSSAETPDTVELSIIRLSGENISLRVETSMSIGALKMHIKAVENLGANSELSLACECENLSDGLLISDLSVRALNLCISQVPLLISGSMDGTIRIWRRDTDQCTKVLQVTSSKSCNAIVVYITAVLRLDMDRFASGSSDGALRVWSLKSGLCIKKLGVPKNGDARASVPTSAVQALARLGDSDCIASGSVDGVVRIWNVVSGDCVSTIDTLCAGSEALIRLGSSIRNDCTSAILLRALCVAGSSLACSLIDGSIHLFQIEDGTHSTVLEGHQGAVNSVISLPGDRLASGSDDAFVRVWSLSDRTCCQIFEGHELAINTLAYLESLSWLASGSRDQTVRIWNLQTGVCSVVLGESTASVWSVMFVDEAMLASGSGDKLVRIWNCETGECLRRFVGHLAPATCVA